MLLAAALLAALAAIAVAGAALRQASRARRELETARSRLARIDAEMPTADQHPAISAKALRRDIRVSFEVSEARADRAVIVQLLIDFRDVSGAEEAIYWRWIPERDSLAPAVWSSEGTRPSFFSITEWAPLVQWSARAGVVQTVGHEETVHVGAAPIRRGETLMGVLSLTHRNGLGWTRSARCATGCLGWPTSSARCRSWWTSAGATGATCGRVRRCWMPSSASRAARPARDWRGRSARRRSRSRARAARRWCAGPPRRTMGEVELRHGGHRA